MHLFRHTSATESAKYMKESELKLMYGWQRESTSPSIYVHLADDDVDKARLKHFGIIKEDTQEDLGLPPTCENCHQQCSSDNDWCDTCSRPITRKAQKEFDDVKEKDRQREKEENLEYVLQHLDENQQGAKTIEKYEIIDNLTQTQTTRKITKKELRELIANQPPGFLADMLTN